jgi:polysaccharide export outer membrane protein
MLKIIIKKNCVKKATLLHRTLKTIGVFIVFNFLFSSCQVINSNALFQIPRGDVFTYDSLPLLPSEDYKLGPGDRFSFLFSTNNGEKIIAGLSGVQGLDGQRIIQQNGNTIQDYLVRQDGTAEIPLIGNYNVSGLTIIQLEDSLQSILSKTYKDPFVQIRVTNQRVVVFPGRGSARVINLNNINTTLLEVIALSGGIANEGRSNSIKLMRKKATGKREIYKIDLSTIQGLKQAEMIVQSNDYIYVDYRPQYATSVLREIGPWLSLVTTTLAVIVIFR